MTGLTFRQLGAADVALLVAAGDEVFDNPVTAEGAEAYFAEPRHYMFGAIADGALVGMASAQTYLHPDKPLQYWVNEVGVADDWLRQGIATRLLELVVDHARALGCEVIWLATEHDNIPARGLYRSAGWRETEGIVMYDLSLGE